MAEMDPIDSVGKSNNSQKGPKTARPAVSGGGQAPFGARNETADEAYDIRIRADGTWTYHGSPIGRPALVKLFSKVLHRDANGDYWLITPAERGRITVDDAPFVAVDMSAAGIGSDGVLTFRTNLEDEVDAGPRNPIRVAFDETTGEPRPYIMIRDGMEALIARSVYYRLADIAIEQDGRIGVYSMGHFFVLDQSGHSA